MYQVPDHQALSEGGQGQALAWPGAATAEPPLRRHAYRDSVSQAPPLRSSNLLLACPSGSCGHVLLARPVVSTKQREAHPGHNYVSAWAERYPDCDSRQLQRSPALPPDGGAIVWKNQRWTMMLRDLAAANRAGTATAVLPTVAPQHLDAPTCSLHLQRD